MKEAVAEVAYLTKTHLKCADMVADMLGKVLTLFLWNGHFCHVELDYLVDDTFHLT